MTRFRPEDTPECASPGGALMSTLLSIPKLLLYSPARCVPAGAAPFSSHVLAVPEDGGRVLLAGGDPATGTALPVGSMLHVEVEDGPRVLVFDTRVVPSIDRNCRGLWVARPQEPQAYFVLQSRETLRAPIHCVVVAQWMRDSAPCVVRAQAVDLGGGGLRLRSKERLPEHAQVRLRIALCGDRPPLQAVAHVIDSVMIAPDPVQPAEFTHESRLQFEALDEAVRQEILQRCFQHQIEQHKRRLEVE